MEVGWHLGTLNESIVKGCGHFGWSSEKSDGASLELVS